MTTQTGLIADIVRSRDLPDRPAAQAAIFDAFSQAEALDAPVSPVWSTVGDEFQLVLPTLGAAVRTTAVVRLALPGGVDLRFGLGLGETWDVDSRGASPIQDGPGWWAARRAIDEAHRRQDTGSPYLRSWFVDGTEPPATTVERMVNAHLLLRDMTVSAMNPRQRRIALGTLLGRTQSELAAAEGITQSAVSQNLARSGAGALVASVDLLRELS